MQSVGSALRRVGTSSPSLRFCCAATVNRAVVWNARRNASFRPWNWIRQQLSPAVREEPSEKELAAARKEQVEKGQGSIFDTLAIEKQAKETKEEVQVKWVDDTPIGPRNPDLQHKYSTANFKISHRKLNKLGQQLSGKPIDSAILQMMFSEKRASKRVKSMLVVAKNHAVQKGLQEKRLVVAEAWVTKGPKQLKRMEPKGRGRFGIRIHPDSRLNVVLREGKTVAEVKEDVKRKKLKRIVSAGLIREDVPLRNPPSQWAW